MASTTNDELRIAEIPTGVTVDPVTLDIIEGALKNARFEMDAVLFRSAMSPVIREQHDEFPMITDPNGRMDNTKARREAGLRVAQCNQLSITMIARSVFPNTGAAK